MAENWNRAIALALGRYVVVLHDDDFFVEGGVGRLVATLERLRDQYPVLLFGVLVVDSQERVMKRQVFGQDQFLSPQEALIRLFSNSSFVRFPAIAVQRSAFETVGFFRPEWKEPCDVEMWMRLFAVYGVYGLSEVTVAYRVHSQALTMASFNEKTIDILLDLFKELSQLNLLSDKELLFCKQLFFYQYVLAGAWRQLRRRNWQAVIIFAKRSIEPDFPHQYHSLLSQLHRVYLDELSIDPNQAIGVNIAELVIANDDVAIDVAKALIAQTRQQIDDSGFQQIVLDLVKAVLVYKLGKDKEQEVKIMFTKEDMKKAWLVQEFMAEAKLEGKAEGKLEGKAEGVQEAVHWVAVNMLKMGISLEQVAAATGLTVEQVQKLLK